jgi:uncharacterized protein (UPF0276 family)
VDAGIGLRAPHFAELLERRPALGFLEVHSENYFAAGGPALAALERFRAAYPLSLHGVGLSLGTAGALDARHLGRLDALVRRFEPFLVSEHLSWSAFGGRHANDLLPLPYTEDALAQACAHVDEVQDRLGRTILSRTCRRTSSAGRHDPRVGIRRRGRAPHGCGVLLDVNNIWVNASNHGFDARRYLAAIDPRSVGEIHLAGFEAPMACSSTRTARAVSDAVWRSMPRGLARFGARPTLVEWDTDIPRSTCCSARRAGARDPRRVHARRAPRERARRHRSAISSRALVARRPRDPRLEVYRRGVLANSAGALAAAYPVVRGWWASLLREARAALRARASLRASGDLHDLRRGFADFLAAISTPRSSATFADVARSNGRCTRRIARPTRCLDSTPRARRAAETLAEFALRACIPRCASLRSAHPVARALGGEPAARDGTPDRARARSRAA